MTVNTKKIGGRRQVRYETLDELLADAERIGDANVRPIGNWSAGQIYEHLSRTMNSSIDGFDFSMPAPVRLVLSLLMKKKFLNKSIPAGFKTSGPVVPDATDDSDGLASLRKAIERQKQEPSRVPHPGFGKITREEWNRFHLRHAELHMSFLVDS